MVNITVSIPDELKAEIDKHPEVNLSEIVRRYLKAYFQKSEGPPLENFALTNVEVLGFGKKPTIRLTVQVVNKLDSDLIIDRVLFTVWFNGNVKGDFDGQHFKYELVRANSSTSFDIYFYADVDMLRYLSNNLKETFEVQMYLDAYVQGFPYAVHLGNKQVAPRYRFPIDIWHRQVTAALDSYDEQTRKWKNDV
jgi:hypothetical protein